MPLVNLWWRLVRLGFHLLYNQLAFTYEAVSWVVSLGAWRCWQGRSLDMIELHEFVLELAHGPGNIQLDLQRKNIDTVGIDLSPNMGQIAYRKLHKNHMTSRLVRSEAQRLPFALSTFDVVVSTFPTNFIVAEATLQEVYRVLCDEGRMIVVSSSTFDRTGLVQRFLEWLYRITGQRADSGLTQIIQADLRERFAVHGFDLTFVYEKCPRSTVQILVAKKNY